MDFALGGKLHRVSAASRLRELFEAADKIPEIIFLRHWLGVCLVGNQNGKTIEHMLEKINDSASCESPVSPSEIVDELLEYNDAEEAKDIMETSGLKETETIDAFKKQDKIKITTDEGISISVPLEVFDQSVDIREESLKISFEKIKFS